MIEVIIQEWNPNDIRNAKHRNKDSIDQRPIYANEYGKTYIRHNGYTSKVSKLEIYDLKRTCFSNKSDFISLNFLTENKEKSKMKQKSVGKMVDKQEEKVAVIDDSDTDYFSYDSE